MDAYRFAKGEEITASSGQKVKLSRPLDFMVVADHSDLMGLFPMIFRGGPIVTATERAGSGMNKFKTARAPQLRLKRRTME